MDQLSTRLFKSHIQLSDNISNNQNLNSPHLKHKTTTKACWSVNWKPSEWTKGAAQEQLTRTNGTSNFLSWSNINAVGTARDAVHARLHQLSEVREIHAHMMESTNMLQLYETNCLLDMYVKCGGMEDALYLFEHMPNRNVVSWNMMILGYAENHENVLALKLYAQMGQEGIQASEHTFMGVLKACSGLAATESEKQVDEKVAKRECGERGRAIHSQVMKGGFESDEFVGNSLVVMYAKCGVMEDARHVFDHLARRNVVSWTAMILGYAKKEGVMALDFFVRMHQEGVKPTFRTFVGALKACSSLAVLEEGKQADMKFVDLECLKKGRTIHSQIVNCGSESNVFVGNILVDMYAKCGNMEDAHHVFQHLPHRNVVSWTAMISAYAKNEEGTLALDMYARMHQEGVQPNDRTFVGALKACSGLASKEEGKRVDGKVVKIEGLEKGRAIHCQILKSGFLSNVFVGNTLVNMYAECGSMEDAHQVFDELPYRTVVSWNALMLGYTKNEVNVLPLELYAQMHKEGVIPDHRTFIVPLQVCGNLAELEEGKKIDGNYLKTGSLEKGRLIHLQVLKSRFEPDVFVGTTLVNMYAKCGSMEDARHVFDKLPHRNVVSWTAMILGYAEQEKNEDAFKLYKQMQEQGLTANSLTFVSILKACGNAAALETGKEIHEQICKAGLETAALVTTTLIDMYAKCGSMVNAQKLFDASPTRDVVRWNALIAGYARQGESDFVFHLYERMREEGIQPNVVTFVSVLAVCSHVGLIDHSQKYFHAMTEEYGIFPTIEHYNCMVALLGRAGKVDEAMDMVEKMPCHPDMVVWLTLLGACRKWKDVEIARYAFDCAIKLDEQNAIPYVLISNIPANVQ